MTHKSYSGINALSVNLLKCLVFTLFLVGWAPAHAQIDLIDPDNFTEQHSYDPCFVETPFEYLPESVNSTLCDEFPNYEPSENCTIAAGTVTVYGQNEVVQNKNFLVNGNWTIRPGSSLIFQNCNFKIAPGAQITVKCFNTQTMTFEGCKFFSCDIMWRGISVEHAFSVLELTPPSFNFINCEIEDAASALWLRNPSLAVLYKIQGSIFNNNYIGLSVFHDWANGIPTWAPLVFWGNTMTTSQNLRPYFSIKTPPGYPKAYAGISAKKVSSYLGTPASRNTFTRMRNGMVCEKSVITVNHNDFIGLWENGIQSNASSLTVLNDNRFDGPTNMPGITPPIMENGIWATGSDLYISDTKFNRRIRNGINSEGNYHAEQIEIHDNYFDQTTSESRHGVLMERSAAGFHSSIPALNRIYNNHCNAVPENSLTVYTGFFIQGQNLAGDEMHVFDNQDINLTMTGTGHGIYPICIDASNFKVTNNKVNFKGNTAVDGTFGIRFSNLFAENNHVELNEVAGLPATSGGPFTLFGSIYILGGLCDYTLCENTVKNSKYGFRFYGNNQFPIISQNKIYDHEYGLSIFSNVSLGYHDGSGNQWLGAYSQWAAEKEGPISPTPSSPISVRFWVPESDVYPYLPSLSDISPNPDLEADPSRKWFRFNPTIPTAYCEPEENASNFTPAEIQLALGASDLIGAALWDARRQLLRKLLEHPELAPSGSIMATFLNQFQATSVGGFAQFDVAFKNARKFSESQQAVFNSQLLAVQQAQHQVAALLSNAGFNPLNLGTNANATDQWNTHTTNLAAAHKLLADARNARFEQLVQQLTALETTNNNLSATTEQEIAQKYVNAIRLQLSKGIPMTASQYQQVLGISNLPESEVGLAQLEATILLNPCDKLNLPGEAENREKQRRPESANPINEPEAFAVYPNPSAGQVQVEIKRPTNGLLKVLNAQGQVIAHIPFSEQQQLSVDLSNQKTGLYCLQFYDDHNKLLYTTKVVITR